jgi:hypothetical protein
MARDRSRRTVGLALGPLAVSQRSTGSTDWIGETPLPARLAEMIKLFLVGVHSPMVDLWSLLAGLLAAGAVAFVLRRGNGRERAGVRDAAVVAVVAVALPLLLAVIHLVDAYDSPNVIAAWIPCAIVVAGGLGAARARRSGTLSACGCAISLAVIAATNALPDFQREDWRGVARALGRPASSRIIVTERYASVPLSSYLTSIRSLSVPAAASREVDFVALNTARAIGSPLTQAGFRLAGTTRPRRSRSLDMSPPGRAP